MPAVTGLVRVRAILVHAARASLIMQVGVKNLVLKTPHQSGPFHRKEHFHTAVQVPRHQIGAAEVDLLGIAVRKVEDPAVLEEAADDARDADVFADAGYARTHARDLPVTELVRLIDSKYEPVRKLAIDLITGRDPRTEIGRLGRSLGGKRMTLGSV